MKKSVKIIVVPTAIFLIVVSCWFAFLNSRNENSSKNKESNSINKSRELFPEPKEKNDTEKGREKGKTDNRANFSKNQPSSNEEKNISQKTEPEILNGVKIGERHRLNVVTQAQQKWFWCAPTTVSMILSSRGKNISQSQLASEMGTYEPFGTHNKDAVKILNRHMFGYDFPSNNQAGYRIETVRDKSSQTLQKLKERIIQNTKDGYPMYFTINPAKIYVGVKNSEHNVAGAGYISTPDGKDIAFIYYVDPYGKFHDKTYGGLKIVTPEELISAMVDPYVTEPNYAW